MYFLLEKVNFHCHVSLLEGTPWKIFPAGSWRFSPKNSKREKSSSSETESTRNPFFLLGSSRTSGSFFCFQGVFFRSISGFISKTWSTISSRSSIVTINPPPTSFSPLQVVIFKVGWEDFRKNQQILSGKKKRRKSVLFPKNYPENKPNPEMNVVPQASMFRCELLL